MESLTSTSMVDFISKLHPAIRQRALDFLAKAKEQGIDLKITFGLRTFEEQQKIYDQGRTEVSKAKGEKIVTKAKPGQSFHNYGLAIDVVPIVKGKADWESKIWSKIGEIGKSVGFSWGGDWKSFKDLPHFEYPPATKYTVLLALKNAGKVDAEGYVILP